MPRKRHFGRAPARHAIRSKPGRRGDVAEADRVVLGRHEFPDAHVAVVDGRGADDSGGGGATLYHFWKPPKFSEGDWR